MENSSTNSSPAPKRKPNDFIFGRVLGEGSFSTVYLAKDIQTSREFAIKVCEKRHIIREKKQQYVTREKEALKRISDNTKASAPFFVRLYCTFQDQDCLYFVLTCATGGDLLTYLQKSTKFDLEVARFYTAELVHAVEFMHMQGIIHRDLKPENILLTSEKHILVTDFGSSKILPRPPLVQDGENPDALARRSSFVGTAQYVSPEILTDKKSSPASDLWAIGCIVYQMVDGNPPFQGRSEHAIFQKILKLDFEYPDNFSEVVRDLISKLLVIDSKERLGAQDFGGYPSIRSHPFFESVDFETLYMTTPPCPSNYTDTTDSQTSASSLTEFQDAEPGLGGQQLTRLLGLQLNDDNVTDIPIPARLSRLLGLQSDQENVTVAQTSPSPSSNSTSSASQPSKRTVVSFPANEQQLLTRLQHQQENLAQWHQLVERKLILKQGLVDKRKGLFSRRRMLLLTVGPSIYYVDPSSMVLKGQIPFGATLKTEAKNFKNFHVHTPGRIYYLEDPDGFALEWCKALEEVRKHYFDK